MIRSGRSQRQIERLGGSGGGGGVRRSAVAGAGRAGGGGTAAAAAAAAAATGSAAAAAGATTGAGEPQGTRSARPWGSVSRMASPWPAKRLARLSALVASGPSSPATAPTVSGARMDSRLAAELPLMPADALKALAIAVAWGPNSEETSVAPWRRSDRAASPPDPPAPRLAENASSGPTASIASIICWLPSGVALRLEMPHSKAERAPRVASCKLAGCSPVMSLSRSITSGVSCCPINSIKFAMVVSFFVMTARLRDQNTRTSEAMSTGRRAHGALWPL